MRRRPDAAETRLARVDGLLAVDAGVPLLALSSTPILQAIGITVSLGVLSNFLLALLLTRERARA